MDAIRTLSALCSAGALSLLVSACSHAPAKTDPIPPKSVYDTPKTLVKPESADPESTRTVLAIPATSTSAVETITPALSESTAAKTPVPAISTSSPAPVTPKSVTPPKAIVMPTPTPAKPTIATPAPHPPAIKPTAPAQTDNTPTPAKHAAESTVALITPAAIAPTPTPVLETLEVTLDTMPLTIHDAWILDHTETQCLLKTTSLKMDDGQGGTPVTLQITPDSLTILTRSDIDLSYEGTGLLIDGKRKFALETVERRTNLSFNTQRQAILDSMRSGRELTLTLGFWPTWPVTHTYSLAIPLTHFATAFQAWETCNQLLSRQ